MLTTKRYEYLAFPAIGFHPLLDNHRALRWDKVNHYESDILKNGLLEPLVVWERNPGEFFLVGGFHRHAAIRAIRNKHPGYFDRVDVRVVAGDPDEIRALNLKLNADRLDTRITDFFDTVVYLNNANWSVEKISQFLDRSPSWIEDILRFAPGMDARLRVRLADGRLSWNKAKEICRRVLAAAPGQEKATSDRALAELDAGRDTLRPVRLLTVKGATRRLSSRLKKEGDAALSIQLQDLCSLLAVLSGRRHTDEDVDRVRKVFPDLLDPAE